MQKNILGVVLISLISFSTYCQDSPRFSISVAAGPSISLRKIYTQITGDQKGELAGDGLAGQVGLSYQLFRHIGITARINYNQNQTRNEGVAKVALFQYNINDPNIVYAKDWTAISTMVGPTLNFELGKLDFEGRLLAGYTMIKGPDFQLNGYFAGRYIDAVTTTGNAQNFAFGAGATVGFRFSDTIGLIVNADFAQTNSNFANVSSIVTSGATSIPQTSTIDQKIGVLNLTAGLRFSF